MLLEASNLSTPSSLKNHGTDAEVDAMFEMGSDFMALPIEEKMRFEQGDEGMSFGQVRHPPPENACT